MDTNAIRTTWAELRRERAEVRETIARRQSELAFDVAREAKLRDAEDALRALLDASSLVGEVDEELLAAVDPVLGNDGNGENHEDYDGADQNPALTGAAAHGEPVAGAELGGTETPRRHVRSGPLVVEAVKAGGGAPVHREEVLAYFERAGVTAGMKNPRNAVNAALKRAVNDHHTLFQITPDTFVVRSADAFMSPEAIAADRLREIAEESS